MGYIKVEVVPESTEDGLVKERDDTFIVTVREKAKQGRANRSMLSLLSKHFGGGMRVRLVSGHHSPHKIVSVECNSK